MALSSKKNRTIKKIGVIIPIANEEGNILLLCQKLIIQISRFHHKVNIIFIIDNASNDKTRSILEKLSTNNSCYALT